MSAPARACGKTLTWAACLLAAGCANAAAPTARDAHRAGDAAGTAARDEAGAEFVPYLDPDNRFELDFWRAPKRSEPKERRGPDATAIAYTVSAAEHDRAQMAIVQALDFPGPIPAEHRCQKLLPKIFEELAKDRLGCPAVSSFELRQFAPQVFAVAGAVRDCRQFDGAPAKLHVVCDERAERSLLTVALVAGANEPDDPINRWFLCSLKLSGNVITCARKTAR